MYRLIIADDEVVIRNGLVKFIDWKSLGFEVVAAFEDGKDILEYLQSNEVDVVFSDVEMFDVSGLEVASWVCAHKPSIKVVLLSGYKEFEYVKTALKHNVFDYILKQLNQDDIVNVFIRVKQELDTEKEEKLRILTFAQSVNGRMMSDYTAELSDAVCWGKQEDFLVCYKQWLETLNRLEPKYYSVCLFELFEVIYKKLESNRINLPQRLNKDQLVNRISLSEEKAFQESLKDVLLQIVNYVCTQSQVSDVTIISSVNTYIDQHMSEDICVEDIAASLCISKSHLSREFKRLTGNSVIEYLIHRRMEKAKELLAIGNLSQIMIADKLGYSDVKYFQKSFKKYTGYTVKEYLRLCKKNTMD